MKPWRLPSPWFVAGLALGLAALGAMDRVMMRERELELARALAHASVEGARGVLERAVEITKDEALRAEVLRGE